MFEKPEILSMAGALSSHAALRQSAIAENIANADTPGFRAKDVAPFAEVYSADDGFGLRATRAGHLTDSGTGGAGAIIPRPGASGASPNGNTVSLETEMVAAADVKQDNDVALAVYRSSLNILRASIGRP